MDEKKKRRAGALIEKMKRTGISPEEKAELDAIRAEYNAEREADVQRGPFKELNDFLESKLKESAELLRVQTIWDEFWKANPLLIKSSSNEALLQGWMDAEKVPLSPPALRAASTVLKYQLHWLSPLELAITQSE